MRIFSRIICVALISCCCRAQSNAEVKVNELSDPAAVKILSGALDSLGGMQQWKNVKGLRVTGTASNGGSNEHLDQIEWLDKWSASGHKMKRTRITANGSINANHGDGSLPAVVRGESVNVPLDETSICLPHAPALALVNILSDPNSILFLEKSSVSSQVTVHMRKQNGRQEQLWTFTSSGALESIRATLTNALNPYKLPWETVDYSSFSIQQGMAFPHEVTVRLPNGSSSQYNFILFQVNPALADTDLM